MSEPIGCCRSATGTAPAPRCVRCDLLVGLDDVYVLDARLRGEHLEVTVESEPGPVGCPDCGAAGVGHGRQVVRLVDIPAFGRPRHDHLAQTPLRLPRRGVRTCDVRGEPAWACLAAACHHGPRRGVGSGTAAPGARHRQRTGSSARYRVAHGVDAGQGCIGGVGR